MTSFYKTMFQTLSVGLLAISVISCGGSSSSKDKDDDSDSNSTPPHSSILNDGAGAPSSSQGDCDAKTSRVNWNALMDTNCQNLSDYNLFSDQTDPTANPNTGGVPYDLSVALFTDYASKYRFVFIPEGSKAQYSEAEVMDFPLGTVLVKTFAMPEKYKILLFLKYFCLALMPI